MKKPNSGILSKKPNFSSATLSDAFNEVCEIFDRHQDDINSVSQDIRNLEAYLKHCNVQVSFSECYGAKSDRYEISWGPADEESKDFRLKCERQVYSFDLDGWVVGDHGRPLIECPLSTRMATYPYLPDFFRSLAEQIRVFSRKKQEPAPNEILFGLSDEIPF
ncbi:MAG: hypothetical protein KF681_08470 [Bdellovibrionaceae bacterium]|nr:hypothetical protein [Pseudobdellovibrionaceae bacterium]